MTYEEFYRRLEYSNVMPIAVPPAFRSFQEAYSELSQSADQIISIHVSSKLNRTYHMATAAAEAFLGRCQIAVIDSASISGRTGHVGQGGRTRSRPGTPRR